MKVQPGHAYALSVVLMSTLAALGCNAPSPPGSTMHAMAPGARTMKLPAAPLSGNVVFPNELAGSATIIAAGGGNIVAAGGGNIIAQGGGNLIGINGGNIVAAGGGNLVAGGGSKFGLLDSAAASPAPVTGKLGVVGAVITLRDPLTRRRLKWAPAIVTDAQGNFSFGSLPSGINYLIEADFVTGSGHAAYRMLSIGKPLADAPVPVTWCCTAMLSTMITRFSGGQTGLFVAGISPQTLGVLKTNLEAAYSDLSPMALGAKQTLAIGAASVNVASGKDGNVNLTVPDQLDANQFGGGNDVMQNAGPKNAVIAGLLMALSQNAAPPTASDQQDLAAVGGTLDDLSQAPQAVNGQFEMSLPMNASPTPASGSSR
jgi:hypothetical protein